MHARIGAVVAAIVAFGAMGVTSAHAGGTAGQWGPVYTNPSSSGGTCQNYLAIHRTSDARIYSGNTTYCSQRVSTIASYTYLYRVNSDGRWVYLNNKGKGCSLTSSCLSGAAWSPYSDPWGFQQYCATGEGIVNGQTHATGWFKFCHWM